MRLLRITLAGLTLAALGVTHARAAAAPSGAPIVIGAILSISGNYAPLGEPERNALTIAEADINAHGGIAGRPLRIKIVDDEGKPDIAQQLATQLVGEHVAAIVGGTLTPTTIAMARVTNESKTVEVYMNPTDTIWNTRAGVMKYLFESTPRNELEANKLLSFIKTKLKRSRVALLHDEAPYGTTGATVVHAAAGRLGIEIVEDESFAVAATDVTAQLQKAAAAKADAILIWTAGPAAPIVVRQARQFAFHGDIVGSTGIVSDNFLRVSGRDGYGVYADINLNYTHPSPAQRAFLEAYHATFGARPSNFASFAWDAAHLIARGLDKTRGDASGDALAGALESLPPYAGTTGTFVFGPNDHNGLRSGAVKICREDGAWVVLE